MTISASDFKSVQSHLAGAVTIITTRDAEGQPWGLTATSFCSLSLDPPLVLFCLATSADCYNAFINSHHFAVNILASQQRELSDRFATKNIAKFEGVQYIEGKTGSPLLPDSLAHLECSVQAIHPGGDHVIVIGLAECGCPGTAEHRASPLLYYTREYGTYIPLSETK
ncbi:MAG TPA: flavin reductase family protein [Ktedonobacteraceae bacterium]|nr:flavin reductase family protein [Ktedonobacteraceae bacterium]